MRRESGRQEEKRRGKEDSKGGREDGRDRGDKDQVRKGKEEKRKSLRRGRGEGCRGGNWPKRREGDSKTQGKEGRDEGKISTRNEEAAADDYFEDRKMTATKAGRQK